VPTKPSSKPTKSVPKSKPAPKKTTKTALKTASKTAPDPEKKQKRERISTAPIKQAPEQVKEQSPEQKPEQSPKFPEQMNEQIQELFPEKPEQEQDVPHELDDYDADTLAIIRKVLDTHEIMEFLPECYVKLDTAKQGDIYRLYLNDEPSNLGIVHKGNRFTVNGKYYHGPAEAAHALCDTLLAQCKRK